MNTKTIIMALMLFASVPFFADAQSDVMTLKDGSRYEGAWPAGEGVLYSYDQGLVFGTFVKGKPDGRCVCYRPSGEVYWGDYKKGKATGKGRIYRDNGIVISGDYKNGVYHGIDTIYRRTGTAMVGMFRKGKLKERIADSAKDATSVQAGMKPSYPSIDFRRRHQEFVNELELRWEERNAELRRRVGFINPEFQGGTLSDFTYWVNSQLNTPQLEGIKDDIRTVVVEFVVGKDGNVRDVHALFGSVPELNAEAVRVVSRSPKWKPGEQAGQKKSVKLTVPVVFEF